MNNENPEYEEKEEVDPGNDFKRLWHELMTSNSLVVTFLRSMVSSQAASWVDYIVRFVLFSLNALNAFWSVACGAVCGGIVNCIINYRFTFRADGCDFRAVIVKYTAVWVGSLLLNSFGSEALYNFVNEMQWVHSFDIHENAIFMVTSLFVSLMVSWFWNFALQRYMVYRPMPFDPYLSRLLGGKKSND